MHHFITKNFAICCLPYIVTLHILRTMQCVLLLYSYIISICIFVNVYGCLKQISYFQCTIDATKCQLKLSIVSSMFFSASIILYKHCHRLDTCYIFYYIQLFIAMMSMQFIIRVCKLRQMSMYNLCIDLYYLLKGVKLD